MFETILLPTDGSETASTAGKAAFALAEQFDANLFALHVLDRQDRSYGEEVVNAVDDAAAELDIPTTTAIREKEGTIHETILQYASEQSIDCIVMGTHGEKNVHRFVLGSVATRTLREAPMPVMTVHTETEISSEVESVLVPTDGSESAIAAANTALEFISETDSALHTVHVVSPNELDDERTIYDAFEKAGQKDVQDIIDLGSDAGVEHLEASVLSGVPHQAINDYVETNDIDYVFMGTHGRTGVSRYLLGSVTERVVRLVDVPIVSVKANVPRD